jgi:hypothetical protein
MERAMSDAIDAKAAAGFTHPGDLIDAEEATPDAAQATGPAFGEVFRLMMAACLPPRAYGDMRRWASGYHRMCALCYRIAPEVFDGATRAEIASKLGISMRAFGKYLEQADEILAGRPAALEPGEGAAKPNVARCRRPVPLMGRQKIAGPSQPSEPIEVPHGAEPSTFVVGILLG